MPSDWLTAQFSPQTPFFWLCIGLLTTALLRSLWGYVPHRRQALLWFGHWLLIPYLGLLAGGLSPRLMGLANIDWQTSVGFGLGLLFGIAALLVFVRAVITLGDPTSPPDIRRFIGGIIQPGGQTLGGGILWSGIEQFHWAFLRGGLHETLLTLPAPPALPGYWAIWGAAGIILAELLWSRPTLATFAIQSATLLTTSILFFYTHNFWLCWALHVVVYQLAVPPGVLPMGRADPARRQV